MRLVLSEKPSMGRAIAQALGITGSGRHSIAGQVDGQPVVVTWCIGHLVEAAPPEAYDPNLKRWTMAGLPILPPAFQFAAADSTRDQWDTVRGLLNRTDVTEVVNAMDAGREGQLIFHLVYDLAGCRKPVSRLWTSSLTEAAIQKAWKEMRPDTDYQGLTDAARCRQEADWLVGINCTRAQTLVARGRGGEGVYSIGRVQTPTLAILVNRELERKNFQPKDFWTVVATFRPEEPGARTYPGKWFSKVDGKEIDRFDKEEDALALVQRLRGQAGVVQSVTSRDEKKRPELLYDLTTLQREANKRFGWTAEHTLEVAQQLYEARLISYPRTNARHLTQADADKAPAWLSALGARGPYAGFVQEIRQMGKGTVPKLGKRFVDDAEVEDHSAIVVTEKAPPVDGEELRLPPDQARLYDLVARRLLAAWYPDRVEARTNVVTVVGKQRGEAGESFKSSGGVLKEAGWSRVDPVAGRVSRGKGEGEDDDEAGQLPPLRKGEPVTVVDLQGKKGQTTPPKPMTEADLLAAMEGAGKELDDEGLRGAMKDCGLGTPATRASVIETLVKRGFVARKTSKKHTILEPTDKGVQLVQAIDVETLKSPRLTGEWEAELARMRRGEAQRDAFMQRIRAWVAELVERIRNGGGGMPASDKPANVVGTCPRCGSGLIARNYQGRRFARCSAIKDPTCKLGYDLDDGGEPAAGRCGSCQMPLSAGRSEGPRRCDWCGRSPQPEPNRPAWPPLMNCEKCRQLLRLVWSEKKGQWYLRCDPCDVWLGPPEVTQAVPPPAPVPCPKCQRPAAVLWSARDRRWFLMCQPCRAVVRPKAAVLPLP